MTVPQPDESAQLVDPDDPAPGRSLKPNLLASTGPNSPKRNTQWPDSLWAATAATPESYPTLSASIRADLCVVGGGFTGLSAALHAAEAGARVALVEAHDVGWGASGRNGGQVIPGLKLEPEEMLREFPDRGEAMVDFAGGSADVVFDLVERHGIECGAERSGWLSAAHARSTVPMLHSRLRQWDARGAPVEWLDEDELETRTGVHGYRGAYFDRRGGKVQPLSYARGLARAAHQAGAQIFAESPGTHLARASGGWRLLTERGSVTAPQVLLCTNGYTDGLWPGLASSVVPAFSYQVATEPLSDNLRKSLLPQGEVVSDTRRLLRYFRLDDQGRLLMGGRGRNLDSNNPRLYREVIANLNDTFPQLAASKLAYFWGGRVALTLDHVPHLHELAEGVYAALGYNGRGVAMATTLGRLLARWAGGLAERDLPFPVTAPKRVPLHGLRMPIIRAVGLWRRLSDALDVKIG